MALPTITTTLTPGQLSDLFFNYDHPERDKLYAERKPEKGELPVLDYDVEWRSVRNDAKEFVALIVPDWSVDLRGDLIEQLATDFMDRR